MNRIILFGINLSLIFLAACKAPENAPQTVNKVELERYTGTWYEIALYPNRFEENCTCTTATYTMTDKGHIKVENRCYNEKKEKWETTTGKAFPVEGSDNTKLKVQFFWPFRGDYWAIDLAADYSWAVVSEPERDYLWILSRSSQLPEATYREILERLEERGFDLSKLKETPQNCKTST